MLDPTAHFSVALPSSVTPARFTAAHSSSVVAALQARLPGAKVTVTRHVSRPPCTPGHGHQPHRALLASPAPAVATVATGTVNATSIGTASNEHGQGGGSSHNSSPTCAGRLVLNVAVAHPNRQRLEALLAMVERQPHRVWDRRRVSCVRWARLCSATSCTGGGKSGTALGAPWLPSQTSKPAERPPSHRSMERWR